ncbi:MAG TPA: transglutaminase domain-containing protein [Flavobacterium sp.]|nr:transglutaminase domain-containing protein [Flavobacterium sp.]HRA71869.1 transglutaminase domain-containing protein [Flavobacterium sp.]
MKNIFLVFTFLFSVLSFGQTKVNYTLIDKKMDAIPNSDTNSTDLVAKYINANFKTESDKIRAVFYWTSSNISYDVANMFVVNFGETPQDRIAKTLKTKKGICGDYAAIFNEIATLVGVKSVVISGYTKQNGKIDTLAHAWCAAKIDNKWSVFDPTWGSGSLLNGKFVKKINEYYFKVEPSKIISSHIPFDYLWQFLNYPITNAEFYEGKTQINKTKKYFDFEKEIARQSILSEMDQLFESAERIEKNGLKNAMIVAYYENQKKHSTVLRENKNIEKLNGIVNEMNEAVVLLNDFIFYRNKKFKPTFPDDEINNMIQKPREKLIKCQNDIYTVGSTGTDNKANVSSIKKSIESNLALAEEHALFVKNYLSKSKMVRKTMFSKVSWFGIPLN